MKMNNSRWLRLALPLLLVFILAITISYIDPQTFRKNVDLASGNYMIETLVDHKSNMLRGPVYFEYSEQQNNPVETRIFKLHFVNPLIAEGPGFGFMIPLPGTEERIEAGTYSVDRERRGIMNNSETVFGYADMGGNTSALYFSDSGSISILTSAPTEILGKIDMVLDDGSGGSIRVIGDFKAQQLPPGIGK